MNFNDSLVVLLSGPPLVGKSELASAYVQRVGAGLIRTDEVRNAARCAGDVRQIDWSAYRSLGLTARLDLARLPEVFQAQAREIWSITQRRLEHCLRKHHSVLIEGIHLVSTINESALFDGISIQRFVLITQSLKQYEELALARCIKRYGEADGKSRFINYRQLWRVYAEALQSAAGQLRVLDASLPLDQSLQVMLDARTDS
jgi:2-phosphoglycerate kinase